MGCLSFKLHTNCDWKCLLQGSPGLTGPPGPTGEAGMDGMRVRDFFVGRDFIEHSRLCLGRTWRGR